MNAIKGFLGLIAKRSFAEPLPGKDDLQLLKDASFPSALYKPVDTGFLRLKYNGLRLGETAGRNNIGGSEPLESATLRASLFNVVLSRPQTVNASVPQDLRIPGFFGQLSDGVISDQIRHIPNADRMPFWDQGSTNGCGTTSLSMVLNYYGINVPRQDIDKAIRRADNSMGATPEDEIEFARQHGLEAEGYNNGTWEEVKSMIDQGYPVMASVTGQNIPEFPDGNLPESRHQIVITGYEKGADGKEYVLFHDPNYGNNGTGTGTEKKISLDDFKKAWGKEDFGVKNYFMVFAPHGSHLPPGRDDGAEGALGTLNGAVNISNGFDRIFSPDDFGCFVHGIPQFFGGIIQTVGCGVGTLFQFGAEKLRNFVDGVPILQNIVEPFTDMVSGFGGCLADVFNGFGKACNSVGGAFESLFHGDVGGFVGGLGKAAGNVVSGAVHAVGDAVGAVGHAVSDFFSGW